MANPNTQTRVQSDEWLCTKEVARLTKLSTSLFEKARLPGRWNGLPWYKIGGRVLYRKSEVQDWMNTFRMTGGAYHV
ncbi:helix-turn-helix transcriptional regulator [Neorhizobium sp. DT-125]|uniref:helix-turn-helix transcriptional regulator n=1 Tax=Neorhizobium sp. DT-125 TaxID=3396163 RepID=UPI003F1B4732